MFLFFALVMFLEQNAFFINIRKVSHIEPCGGGCRFHFSLDFALHLPLNRFGSIYFPHSDASSAMVITFMYFLHWFACWSSRGVTPTSLLSLSIMLTSCCRCISGHHTFSMLILPPISSNLSCRCITSPGSIYATFVDVSSRIGRVSPDSSCAWANNIFKSVAFSCHSCSCRMTLIMPF